MPVTATELVQAAHAVVPKISTQDAMQKISQGALLLDIRDAPPDRIISRVACWNFAPTRPRRFTTLN